MHPVRTREEWRAVAVVGEVVGEVVVEVVVVGGWVTV
jgi:hypothetical protein